MHPDLSPHLHTPECNILIEKYKQCNAERSIAKFWGACNNFYHPMIKCLWKELEDNRIKNHMESREKLKEFRAKLKEDK